MTEKNEFSMVPEKPIDVSNEFNSLPSLAKAFVDGGAWLAKQRDPVRQFEEIAKKAG